MPRYLTWEAAQALITRYHAAVKRSSSGEAFFHYAGAGSVSHTVYFQDRAAVKSKLAFALAQRPAIAGIAIWVMGGEDPGLWPVIGGLLVGGQPGVS